MECTIRVRSPWLNVQSIPNVGAYALARSQTRRGGGAPSIISCGVGDCHLLLCTEFFTTSLSNLKILLLVYHARVSISNQGDFCTYFFLYIVLKTFFVLQAFFLLVSGCRNLIHRKKRQKRFKKAGRKDK